jgi:hypothetical protein
MSRWLGQRHVALRYVLPNDPNEYSIDLNPGSNVYKAIHNINAQHSGVNINALAPTPLENPFAADHVFNDSSQVVYCLVLQKLRFRLEIVGRTVVPVLKVIQFRDDATFDDLFDLFPVEFQVPFTDVTLNGQSLPTDGPIYPAIVRILGRVPDLSVACDLQIFLDQTKSMVPVKKVPISPRQLTDTIPALPTKTSLVNHDGNKGSPHLAPNPSQPPPARLAPNPPLLQLTAFFLTYSGISSEVAMLDSNLQLDRLGARYESLMNSGFQQAVLGPLRLKRRTHPLKVIAFAPGGTPWTTETLHRQFSPGRRMVLYTAAFLDDFASVVPVPKDLTQAMNASEDMFGCYIEYLKRNGKERCDVLKALGNVIPFPPFACTLKRILENRGNKSDLNFVRETLRTYMRQWVPESSWHAAFEKLGYVLSNLARSCDGWPELPIDDQGAWMPDRTDGPEFKFRDAPLDLAAAYGAPMEPVSRLNLRPRTGNFIVTGRRTSLVTSDNDSLTVSVSGTGDERPFKIPLWSQPPADQGVIDQVDVVLLDESGTMGTVSPQLRKRKVDAAFEYAVAFFAGVAMFSPCSLYGYSPFAEQIQLKWGFHCPCLTRPDPGGASTEILAVLRLVAEQIGGLHLRHGVRKRVLVITDGDDFHAFDASEQSAVCQLLGQKDIVVDMILIGNAIDDEAKSEFESKALNFLSPLCYSTGGLMFHPSNEDESKHITKCLTSEAFTNLRVRMLPIAPRILNGAAVAELQKLQKELRVFTKDIPTDIPFKQSDARVEIDETFAVNDGIGSRYRRERIAAEVLECKRSGHSIWAIKDKVGHFRVLIGAPLEAHDDKFLVNWDLVVSFPPDYPYGNPVFRFLSVPPLKRVSELGLVTVTQESCVSLTLARIRMLFGEPAEWLPRESIRPRPRWTRDTWWKRLIAHDFSVPLPLVSAESIEFLLPFTKP